MLALKTFPHPLELRTRRCLLRQWQADDLPGWAALNADLRVRACFASVLTADEADAEAGRLSAAITQRGWGMWALELPGVLRFAGTVGLFVTTIDAPFVPCVELGWRLSTAAWGQGLATEAAQAAMTFAFDTLALDEVVAFTAPANLPSQAVMQRLGMARNAADDFDHPRLAPGHPLRPHVLYRARRAPPP